MITYLIGSFWWLIVKNVNNIEDIDAGNTFIRNWALDEIYWYEDPHFLCQRGNCKAAMKTNEYMDILKYMKDNNITEALGDNDIENVAKESFFEDCFDKKWREDPAKGRCT